ncbi:MAG: cytochrome c [Myxococcales bacterium]|nr:cytochrome c [Myxococcales bacterium]
MSNAGAQSAAPTAPPRVGSRTGQQAWSAVCANCHMPRTVGGRVRAPTGPRLENKRTPEAEMRNVIRNGHGTMRPIPAARLADSELAPLIAYLRTFNAVR